MHRAQEQVREFHILVTKQHTSPAEPKLRNDELRAALIIEESLEAAVATVGFERAAEIFRKTFKKIGDRVAADPECGKPSLVGALGEYADLLYVTYGSFEDAGVDGEPFFEEVHRANMTKVGAQVGQEPAGKMLKPEGWKPPDIAGVLANVRYERLKDEVKRLMDEGKIPRSPTREEKISWVYGNCKLSNEKVTREMVEAAVDKAEKTSKRAIGLYAVLARDVGDFLDMLREEETTPAVLSDLYLMLSLPNEDHDKDTVELNAIGASAVARRMSAMGLELPKIPVRE